MTLIELMIAVALGGLVLLGARALLYQIEDAGSALGRSARATDRLSNATRTLYALARRADVRSDSASRFVGDSLGATFPSTCRPSPNMASSASTWSP